MSASDRPPRTPAQPPDLDSLLGDQGRSDAGRKEDRTATRQPTSRAGRAPPAARKGPPAKSLDELMQSDGGGGAVSASNEHASPRAALPTLEQLTADTAQANTESSRSRPPAPASRRGASGTRATRASLDTLTDGLQSHTATPTPGRTRTPAAAPTSLGDVLSDLEATPGADAKRRRAGKTGLFLALGLVLVIAVVIGGLRFLAAPALPQGETPLARELMTMVAALEDYHRQNHHLPLSLSELPQFPKGAIEWDYSKFELTLVPPRLEFFYGQAEGGYWVLARYDQEAWIYATFPEPKLQSTPAH